MLLTWQNYFMRNLEQFKYYIAGLFEGDGHISLPPFDVTKKVFIPRFNITANIKDLPLLEYLNFHFGHGFIRKKIKNNAVVWTIGNLQGILKIINWLNGKLYTPKVEQFNLMIDWINKEKNLNIIKEEVKEIKLDNMWLTGFLDADSCFYLRATTKGKKERYSAKMTIDQRWISNTGRSYEPIMMKIKDYLEGSIRIVQKANGKNYYTLTVESKQARSKLILHLEKYKLKSSKYLDYECWKEGIKIIEGNKILMEIDKTNFKLIKTQMNNSRKIFSWKHLKDEGMPY